MTWRWIWPTLVFTLITGIAAPADAQETRKPAKAITWKKTVLDKVFRSEGVAVADVNKDGKPDVLAGDVWYEAPDWKMHAIRKDRRDPKSDPRPWDPLGYSESFACFADDFNADGWPDLIVIPFPGKECFWYENPKNKPGLWPEHLLTTSACNETPLYADLFATRKRVLVMGWQPKGQENLGEMCWFEPGEDPTKPWRRHSISGPSEKGKPWPGTHRFAHGLGVGDVNGDVSDDVICTGGWWEQPAKLSKEPWKFHPANLGDACADMYAFDLDGDGTNDVISSSAHQLGLWWHRHQAGKGESPSFVRRDLFPAPPLKPAVPAEAKLSKEEQDLLNILQKARAERGQAPLLVNAALTRMARTQAEREAQRRKIVKALDPRNFGYQGTSVLGLSGEEVGLTQAVRASFSNPANRRIQAEGIEIGIGYAVTDGQKYVSVVTGKSPEFYLFSQSHALNLVDINGDGLKDLVTGRRKWAHGPKGDVLPGGPPVIYWFEARRGKDGVITFVPHLIDDDSGIGTQFAVADINGDGLLDVIVANKHGVFVIEQVRGPMPALPPNPKQDRPF
jgi:hypothetical protein